MLKIEICAECKGTNKLRIKNAYDPESVEEVICDYCDNGVVNSDDLGLAFVPVRKGRNSDLDVN